MNADTTSITASVPTIFEKNSFIKEVLSVLFFYALFIILPVFAAKRAAVTGGAGTVCTFACFFSLFHSVKGEAYYDYKRKRDNYIPDIHIYTSRKPGGRADKVNGKGGNPGNNALPDNNSQSPF
jgi:hypothetical protein